MPNRTKAVVRKLTFAGWQSPSRLSGTVASLAMADAEAVGENASGHVVRRPAGAGMNPRET